MTNKRWKICSGAVPAALLLLSLSTVSLHAEDRAALKERLHRTDSESSLDDPALKSWHLKVSVQLFDEKGQPKDTGTIEEWWAAPNLYKIVYDLHTYKNSEIHNDQGLFQSAPTLTTPEMLETLRLQIEHPMPDAELVEHSLPDIRKESFGKVTLDCVMLTQPIKGIAYPPLGLFPTYCLDHDKTSLRATFDYGTMLIERSKMGIFQGKNVPIDQTISMTNVLAAKGHLEFLRVEQLAPAYFLATDDMVKDDQKLEQLDEVTMAGRCTHKVNPIYPEHAKATHTSGTVTLRAIIGKDGRIHSLKVLSAPDADLAIASIAAVRQWTYTPYLVKGKATEVDTTVQVNFAFSHM